MDFISIFPIINIFSLFSGILLFLMGWQGNRRFRRPDKVLISIISMLVGFFLILYGLGLIKW